MQDLSKVLGEMMDNVILLENSSLHSDKLMSKKINRWAAHLNEIMIELAEKPERE